MSQNDQPVPPLGDEFRAPEPTNRGASRKNPDGSLSYSYTARGKDADQFAFGDDQLIKAVGDHLEKTLPHENGKVFHELVSIAAHIDVHIVPPSDDRPFYTLVTSGMAERPMRAPTGAEQCEFAELAVCLPADWPGLDGATDEWKDPNNYWPIRWLKQLARFPHEFDTWLWDGHTIPNGNPPAPFAPNTRLCSWILGVNTLLPHDFHKLRVGDRDILFLTLYPLYEEELQWKLSNGSAALFDKLDQCGVTAIIDPKRANVFADRDTRSFTSRQPQSELPRAGGSKSPGSPKKKGGFLKLLFGFGNDR